MSVDLTIRFDSQEALDEFTIWLSEQGEQDYWTWMECQDDKPEVNFVYHHPQNEDFPHSDNLIFAPTNEKKCD